MDFKASEPKFILNQEGLEEYQSLVLQLMALNLKREVILNVMSTAAPYNFYGEALDYISSNGLIFTEDLQNQLATRIFNEFKSSVDDLVIWDDINKNLFVSEQVATYEFGDFFKPSLRIITNAVNDSIKAMLKESE